MSPADGNISGSVVTSGVTSGQVITEAISVEEDIATEPSIHISQEAFYLCEADFLRIKSAGTKTSTWGHAIFICSLGIILVPSAKMLQSKVFNTVVQIETWEWLAPIIGFIASLIIYGIGKMLPDEKKQVMNDIEHHFSTAPRKKHLNK